MTEPGKIKFIAVAQKQHRSSAKTVYTLYEANSGSASLQSAAPIAAQAARLANATARKRTPPDYSKFLYGEFEVRVKHDPDFRMKTRDRLAYVYVTGQFPSHVRPPSNALIRTVTRYFKRPVALDGRSGNMKLKDEVVENLELEAHPMVREVRERIANGFLIQPSIGPNTRRNFWKIYMFKMNSDGVRYSKITVQGDGAIKQGWS